MSWLTHGAAAHRRWLESESDRLLHFARASEHPSGGFAWLDDGGRPLLDAPVELWITGRMTHVFALGVLLGRPGCGPLVDHGMTALLGRLRDERYGGWFSAVGSDGPSDRSKQAYGHAFVVLAASSATACGHPDGGRLLTAALDTVDERFWSEEHAMVVDRCDESFREVEPYRGVNANMHTVEAFLAASDVTGDPGWRSRAVQIAERVVREAGRSSWRIPEHYDADWRALPDYNADAPADQFRPYGATAGHGLEWARLLVDLAAALGPDAPSWLLPAAESLFERAVEDSWCADGQPGFVYTNDWTGAPVVRQRMHWVVAEAIATAAALHRVTGAEQYAGWYRTWWDYAHRWLLDVEGGSWWHELDEHNVPSSTVWAGKPDVYHALQATLLPRLPAAPTLATAIARGLLDS